MPFDIAGAKAAGYTDDEITDFWRRTKMPGSMWPEREKQAIARRRLSDS